MPRRRSSLRRIRKPSNEPVFSIHRETCWDGALNDRPRLIRRGGVPAASGVATAAGGLSNDFGGCVAAGSESADDGVFGSDAARTAIRPYLGRDRNDVFEFAGTDQDHAAIRSE